MKSKFDAFRNLYGIREPQESKHEEDVIFYTKWFSMQMSTQNDQEEEKMALDILKITMQYCYVLKQEEKKKYKVLFFLSFRDITFLDSDSISF